jgi:hypothetical protein
MANSVLGKSAAVVLPCFDTGIAGCWHGVQHVQTHSACARTWQGVLNDAVWRYMIML